MWPARSSRMASAGSASEKYSLLRREDGGAGSTPGVAQRNSLEVLASEMDRPLAKLSKPLLVLLALAVCGVVLGTCYSVQRTHSVQRAPGVSASAGSVCPGSPAWVHASCSVEALLETSCAKALEEFRARVGGQPRKWHDPHNDGTYSAITDEADGSHSFSRLTGDKKYTDLIRFSLRAADGGKCVFSGCSESQVFSVGDFSTNFCTQYNLYCGSAHGCKPVMHDFASSELQVKPSIGASKDMASCLVV
jgi:hypothetical protein